jgi:hypothetical protein
MTFLPAVAFMIAAATSAALLIMGVRNSKQGWRRSHSNDLMDVFLLWMDVVHGRSHTERSPDATPDAVKATSALASVPQPASVTADLADQLLALNTALGPARPHVVDLVPDVTVMEEPAGSRSPSETARETDSAPRLR